MWRDCEAVCGRIDLGYKTLKAIDAFVACDDLVCRIFRKEVLIDNDSKTNLIY